MEEPKQTVDRKEYMRNYMKQRRQVDDEFRRKQNEAGKKVYKKRYETDPEFRKKQSEYGKARYAAMKAAVEKLKELGI